MREREFLEIKIIDFEKKYENKVLKLFYKSVYNSRKEFDYARLPSWYHRYSLEKNSFSRLAILEDEVIGSLGLIPYNGYIHSIKKKIGFFVDNCVLPKYISKYDQIMTALFKDVEEKAREKKIDFIIGWEYTNNADEHVDWYKKMDFSRTDGINWFGGGTKHVHCFSNNRFNLSFKWKFSLKLLAYKHYFRELRLKPLSKTEKVLVMEDENISEVVKLINNHNKDLLCSPRYTNDSLKKLIQKYNANGLIVVNDKTIVGVIIYIVSPWSGWMYGKPEYSKSYGIFLINQPIEFAVIPEYSKKLAPHLLLNAMTDEKLGKYLFLVNVFDRRIYWLREAFLDIGADEYPFDYGSVFFKNLSNKKLKFNKPIYVPSNLVISPYTTKDY